MGKTDEILFSAVSVISARGKVFGFRPKAELACDSVMCDGFVDHGIDFTRRAGPFRLTP